MIDKFGAHLVGFYIFKGLIKKVGNISAVSEALQVSESTVKKTIEDYNAAASLGSDSLGKHHFQPHYLMMMFTMWLLLHHSTLLYGRIGDKFQS